MAEGSVDRSEITRYTTWSRRVDNTLTWTRVTTRTSSAHTPWHPGLEQKLIDFNARYEQVCLED